MTSQKTPAEAPPAASDQKPLDTAPPAPTIPPDPQGWRVVFHVEKDGIPIDLEREHVRGSDLMAWLARQIGGLKQAGFEGASPEVHVEVPAGQPGAAGGGQAVLIPSEGGGPPRCSLHGAMKWIEGAAAASGPNAGKPYAFWGCTVRGCKPKEAK